MEELISRSNVKVNSLGNTITTEKGVTYNLFGNVLLCNGKTIARSVRSIDEAIKIVIGLDQ